MIIGISGKARSGKDTAGSFLVLQGFRRISFGDTLKRVISEAFDLPIKIFINDDLKDQKFKNPWTFRGHDAMMLISVLEDNGVHLNVDQKDEIFHDVIRIETNTPREILQKVGSDIVRRIAGEDTWVKMTLNSRTVVGDDDVVVTDVRFPNELAAIKARNGNTILIQREGLPNATHISEQLPNNPKQFDYIIENNASLEDFENNVNLIKGLIDIEKWDPKVSHE